jgi:alkyl hydroperoxide reductase subunit AhpC
MQENASGSGLSLVYIEARTSSELSNGPHGWWRTIRPADRTHHPMAEDNENCSGNRKLLVSSERLGYRMLTQVNTTEKLQIEKRYTKHKRNNLKISEFSLHDEFHRAHWRGHWENQSKETRVKWVFK